MSEPKKSQLDRVMEKAAQARRAKVDPWAVAWDSAPFWSRVVIAQAARSLCAYSIADSPWSALDPEVQGLLRAAVGDIKRGIGGFPG